MGFAAVFVTILSVFTVFYAEQIMLLFQKLEEVVTIGAKALRFAAVGLMFMPLTIPINMLYQSIRKAGIASILSTLRSGALLIPTLLIGVPILGLTGIQIAQPIADVLTGIISIPFIFHFLRKES
jgi:Na+-driven multidrug efflux pump